MDSNFRMFIGNLPENSSEKDLSSTFSSFGEIVNIDIKYKPDAESDKKKFAFVTLFTSEYKVKACLKHFANEFFLGRQLYVTRARESFLERLQREREQAQQKDTPKLVESNFSTKKGFEVSRNNKRKFINDIDFEDKTDGNGRTDFNSEPQHKTNIYQNNDYSGNVDVKISQFVKKQESEAKRLESMKRKRQEFKEKKMIIKTGLIGIDKPTNKKIFFSDNDDVSERSNSKRKPDLFEGDGSGDEINFEIKEQFEGRKGQKVLELQSKYKTDKRFVLDERFAEESNEEDDNIENIELNQADEKATQLNILQNVLGVPIKTKHHDPSNKVKTKIGMLRFNPLQPEHAKFFAPIEPKQDNKKYKKKKSKDNELQEPVPVLMEIEKVEVSKEQFYEVSDVLKESITQPTAFSLRSLFSKGENNDEEPQEQEPQSIPIGKKMDKKVKNTLDIGEKNPFVYDSSDSEDEETKIQEPVQTENPEVQAVWRENLFFTKFDNRLKDGLEFFNTSIQGSIHKERRQLKSVMKKRLYNKERKNKMFQKKIGGRKKTMKMTYRKN
ncbi:probable RNA-binding protein CG14230 [Pieris brassicae]|uniref:probable RNA-binding protein CG14230 n=1 Tax=Pieris brassicae TaxID=7116 RepID=UPI001E65EDC8|nr:probable RNA-binding protein CG14230 [Pieris brassicae]